MTTLYHNDYRHLIDSIFRRIYSLSRRVERRFRPIFFHKNPPEPVIEKLKHFQCHLVPHTKRNLLEHLQETYRLLKKWNASEPVCLAGLCHSIYGTQSFSRILVPLENRDEIRDLIGSEAEKLVYYYCILDRNFLLANLHREENFSIKSRLDGRKILITELEVRNLLEIFIADRLEQMIYTRPQDTLKEFFREARQFLSQEAQREFLIAYPFFDKF